MVKKIATRKCTDCGKPTTNYRCESCWIKRRGFGTSEASGYVDELSTPDERRDAKARRGRCGANKPAPSVRDGWEPLLPRPDRQAGFFNQMQKGNTMEKTYTVQELAALIGVTDKDICNAKRKKNGNFRIGSKLWKIREYMREHGIPWDSLVIQSKRQGPIAAPVADCQGEPDGAAVIEPSAPAPHPNFTRDPSLGHIPLEALISEITRRMPRAEVVLK